jgi:hypothetical protein
VQTHLLFEDAEVAVFDLRPVLGMGLLVLGFPLVVLLDEFGWVELEVEALRLLGEENAVKVRLEVFYGQFPEHFNLHLLSLEEVLMWCDLRPVSAILRLQVVVLLSNLGVDGFNLGLELLLCQALYAVLHGGKENVERVHDILARLFGWLDDELGAHDITVVGAAWEHDIAQLLDGTQLVEGRLIHVLHHHLVEHLGLDVGALKPNLKIGDQAIVIVCLILLDPLKKEGFARRDSNAADIN